MVGVRPTRFGETKPTGHLPRWSESSRSGYRTQVMMTDRTRTIQMKKIRSTKMCIGYNVGSAQVVWSPKIGGTGQ
jgi:hypothetical protein